MSVIAEPTPEDVAAWLATHLGIEGEQPPEGPLVPADRVLELAAALKAELDFRFFLYCAAAHLPAAGEDPDRTVVHYRLRRLPHARLGRPTQTFQFRVMVPTGQSTPSLAGIWAGADWQEREQLDLVGTLFADHPDPRRIMMPEDWPGHPLRRDYAIDTSHYPWR